MYSIHNQGFVRLTLVLSTLLVSIFAHGVRSHNAMPDIVPRMFGHDRRVEQAWISIAGPQGLRIPPEKDPQLLNKRIAFIAIPEPGPINKAERTGNDRPPAITPLTPWSTITRNGVGYNWGTGVQDQKYATVVGVGKVGTTKGGKFVCVSPPLENINLGYDNCR
jgi:hypothetical protein